MSDRHVITQFHGDDVWRDEAGVVWVRQAQLVEVAARAWDEGERHESEYLNTWGQFCPGDHCNPYRERS